MIKFDLSRVRPWYDRFEKLAPLDKPFISVHRKGEYELYYLAALHEFKFSSSTLKQVRSLFRNYEIEALVIESLPYSEGVSPKWFLNWSRRGSTKSWIKGGEGAYAAHLAEKNRIPFCGGEIDHKTIFKKLKAQGYSNKDILGFYLARQVPQWRREGVKSEKEMQKKAAKFIANHAAEFGISPKRSPRLEELKEWYFEKNHQKFDLNISTSDVAPYGNGRLFTQLISVEVGYLRDRFPLDVMAKILNKYKHVAVVYGGGHYMTQLKCIEKVLGRAKNRIVLK